MNIDYTQSAKYELIDWLQKHRTKFKGIKATNADVLIKLLTMATPALTADQFREMFAFICDSYDVDKDEKHFVKRPRKKKNKKK